MPNARLRLLPALVTTVLLAGCGRPALPPQRLIEEEPSETFRTDLVARREVVFRWRLASPEDLADWQVQGAGSVASLADGGVVVRGPHVDLSREMDLPAQGVDSLEVDLLPLRAKGGELLLSWERGGGVFGSHPRLSVSLPRLSAGFATRTFYLSDLPEWRGRVGGIRLQLPGPGMGIREVRGVRMRFEAADLAAALGRAWKVELDSEVRTARLAPPGSPIEWPLTVAAGDRLRFAYGVNARTPGTIRFRISARRPDSEPIRLFEELVTPAAERAPQGWREEAVDLERLGPGNWTLVFETEDVDGVFNPVQGFPVWGHPEILPPPQARAPPNILLISVDTLRPDHLTFYGYDRPTSPNLERWAERSTAIFDNAIAPTPSTLFSHASMLSGRWSLLTGIDRLGRVPPETTLLAEHLRRAGYTTRAVTGGGWLNPLYGLGRGFDVYRYWSQAADRDRELEEGVERTDRWLRSRPASPFFLFLHTYEVHGPFEARQPYLEKLGGPAVGTPVTPVHYEVIDGARRPYRMGAEGEPEEVSAAELAALYDAGIAHADGLLARILTTLQQAGLDRDTVVVLTSDHGEALGENDLYAHGHLYDTNLRVPLVVALPGGEGSARRIPQQVSLADLMPTLLELAGVAVPDGLDGLSLVPLLEGRTASHRPEAWSHSPKSGTAIRISNRLKYIYRHSPWGPELEGEELYRLDEDPDEEHDVAAAAAETARLRERARSFLRGGHHGLRMSFDNSTDRTFRGSLSGDMLLAGSAVIAPEMPCPCLRRRGLGRAGLEIPPGKRFELYFAVSGATRARLEGELPGGATLDESLDLTTLAEAWRWSSAGVADSTGLDIVVWWQGGLTGEARAPEPDPQLVEQLRDLGYLE